MTTTTTTTTTPAMQPEQQSIIENYRINCEERFLQAFLNTERELIIDFRTRGGHYVRRRFLDPFKPDYYESTYYYHWNENSNEPFGIIFSRINNPDF